MRDIREYLYLHLGCKVLIEKSCYTLVHNHGIGKGDIKLLDEGLLFLLLQNHDHCIYKPFLIPISEMTEEKRKEAIVIEHSKNGLIVTTHFETMRQLLKEEYDLFRLIPEGLALEKK